MPKPLKKIVSIFARGDSFDFQYYPFLDKHQDIIDTLNGKGKQKPSKTGHYTIKEAVLMLILADLKALGTDKQLRDRVMDGLQYKYLLDENKKLHKQDLHFLEYYIFRVFMKDEVNIYIFPKGVEIATVNEFLFNKSLDKFPSYIIISLNDILAKLYNREDLIEPKDYVLDLTENEIDVIEQIRINDKKIDINISFKDAFIFDEMNVKENIPKEHINDLGKIANDKDFGKFEDLQIHRGKITSGKVIKKKRFDK